MTVNEDPKSKPPSFLHPHRRSGSFALDLRSTPVSGEFCGGFLSSFLSIGFSRDRYLLLYLPVRERILPS
jgi:hypothetical protein